MAGHATTINAVPAAEGRQQGTYSSTGIGSYWSEVEHGGHFAAMESPQLYVQDVRKWVAAL
ncbi:hypothetical protein GJA_5170 [Janthinobacterium agaricidamnosum NBRC 102515 = DSM 9628]|uniref:Epoxide hydrolase n=1 Tax=Janthinobacterium agaricidamnosum NBRC 102515 = DSM 9628 TaxID=1349767 RepID=W0VEK2_9BURK|nr:hypothetical protein GJA_5170 [Janthinobacterium agaricidamnosum NBRC 102515 = DSM 9628]